MKETEIVMEREDETIEEDPWTNRGKDTREGKEQKSSCVVDKMCHFVSSSEALENHTGIVEEEAVWSNVTVNKSCNSQLY